MAWGGAGDEAETLYMALSKVEAIWAAVFFAAGCVSLFALTSPERWGAGVVLCAGLSLIAAVDLRRMIIPEVASGPLIVTGLVFGLWVGPEAALARVIGAVAGYGAIWAFIGVYALARGRQGMGPGDAMLLAAGGAWLGWPALAPILVLACVSGLTEAALRMMLRKLDSDELPFGPHLALAVWGLWLVAPAGVVVAVAG